MLHHRLLAQHVNARLLAAAVVLGPRLRYRGGDVLPDPELIVWRARR